jgi:hypothetical protein
MAVSQTSNPLTPVSSTRIAILLPVGSPSERFAAIMSLNPVIVARFGTAVHSEVHPAMWVEKRQNPGNMQIESNDTCLVLIDTGSIPNDPTLMRQIRLVKNDIDNEYLNAFKRFPRHSPPAPWLQQGVHITVGPITSFI